MALLKADNKTRAERQLTAAQNEANRAAKEKRMHFTSAAENDCAMKQAKAHQHHSLSHSLTHSSVGLLSNIAEN